MNINPKALLVKVLSTPDDENALKQVAAHRKDVLHYLESAEADETLDLLDREPKPAWVARVFETLAGPVTVPDEEKAIIDALFSATKGREQELGMIFRTVLLPSLPVDLLRFDYWFHGVSVIDDKLHSYLINRPVVKAALSDENLENPKDPIHSRVMDFVFDQVKHGLTPLTLFYAIESVSGLIEEAIFNRELSEDAEFRLIYEASSLSAQPHPLSAEALLEEIEERCNCARVVAQGLLIWLIEVARYKPLLFRWFASSPLKNGVSLSFTGQSNRNLYERWEARSHILQYYERLPFDVHHQKKVIPLIEEIKASNAHFNDNDSIRYSYRLGREMLRGWGKK